MTAITMEAILSIFIMLALAGGWYWLWKAGARDRQRMGEILGLFPVSGEPAERGDDHILGHYHQTVFLRGELNGYPASVWTRSVRRFTKHNSKNQSLYTVLAFELPRPSAVQFRIEPALAGRLQSLFGGDQDPTPSGDEEFDKLFRFTATDPGAVRAFLTPELLQLLLTFRRAVVGDLPDTTLGRFSGDLLFGTFALESHRATYTVSGSPREKFARHFEVAAGFLAKFADHVRSGS